MASPAVRARYHAAMHLLESGSSTKSGAVELRALLDTEAMPDTLRAEASSNLATALVMLGRSDEAVVAFRAALAGRDSGLTRYNLAIVLAERGAAREAEVQYRAAVRLDASLEGAWNNLGNLQVEAGRADEAMSSFRAAIRTTGGGGAPSLVRASSMMEPR